MTDRPAQSETTDGCVFCRAKVQDDDALKCIHCRPAQSAPVCKPWCGRIGFSDTCPSDGGFCFGYKDRHWCSQECRSFERSRHPAPSAPPDLQAVNVGDVWRDGESSTHGRLVDVVAVKMDTVQVRGQGTARASWKNLGYFLQRFMLVSRAPAAPPERPTCLHCKSLFLTTRYSEECLKHMVFCQACGARQPEPMPAPPERPGEAPPLRTMVAGGVTTTETRDDRIEEEIEHVLNRHSRENASNTPDWILAPFLMECLRAFERATRRREEWYGRSAPPDGTVMLSEQVREAVTCSGCSGLNGNHEVFCRTVAAHLLRALNSVSRYEIHRACAPIVRQVAHLEHEIARMKRDAKAAPPADVAGPTVNGPPHSDSNLPSRYGFICNCDWCRAHEEEGT